MPSLFEKKCDAELFRVTLFLRNTIESAKTKRTLYYLLNYLMHCDIIKHHNQKGDVNMAASYKKLWKLLIDRDLKKKDLQNLAGISNYTVSKLNRGENITTDILGKICKALDCSVDDIMEFVDK